MKILISALLCFFSLFIFAQEGTTSGEQTGIKKNGFLSSLVVDETGMPLIVQIDITDNTTSKIVQQFQSSRIGYSRISLPSGNYNIVFSKQGYLFHSENFVILDTAGYEKKLKKVILKKVEVGNNTVLKNIAFEENQSVLKETSFNDLQRVLELMNEIVSLQIELSGDIGSDGQAITTKELSEQRAKVLIDYLVSKGIDRKRLKYKENDAEHPIELVNPDDGEENVASSQVQVKIVEMGAQKLVQTEGQYYAVPETPTKKTKKGKKKDTEKAESEKNPLVSSDPVIKSDEPIVAKENPEATTVTETPKEETVVASEKPVEKVSEENTSSKTAEDIVAIDAKTVETAKEETKKEEVKTPEQNTLQDTPAKEYVDIAAPETKDTEPVVAEPKKEEPVAEEEKVITKTTEEKSPEVVEPLTSSENNEPVVAEPKKEEPVAEEEIAKATEEKSQEVVEALTSSENKEPVIAEPKKEEPAAVEEKAITKATEEKSTEVVEPLASSENKESKDIVELVSKTEEPADEAEKKEEPALVKSEETSDKVEKREEEPVVEAVAKNEDSPVIVEKKDEEPVAETIVKKEETPAIEKKDEEASASEAISILDEIVGAKTTEDKPLKEEVATVDIVTPDIAVSPVETTETEKANIAEIKDEKSSTETKNEEELKSAEKTDDVAVTEPINNEPLKNAEETQVAKEGEIKKDTVPDKKAFAGIGADTTVYTLENIRADDGYLGKEINSAFPDYAPLISADGNTLVFTSRRPLNKKDIAKARVGKENIYISYFDIKNKVWSPAEMMDAVINIPETDNIATALSADGQRILLYRAKNDQNLSGDIYESVLNGDVWSEPVKLPSPINTSAEETFACISSDGQTIYFVSDRKGGLGGKDVWSCTKDKFGKWGEAINLGASVNSTLDEESIFIHPNGNTLFFSSKGHQSSGGADIFMATLDETSGKWGKVTNMGNSVNTEADDIYFVVAANGKTAYTVSSESGDGNNDIASLSYIDTIIQKSTVLLKGSVIDENGRFIKSKITFADQANDKPIGLFSSNRATGKYVIPLPVGKTYNVTFTAKGYTTFVESVETSGMQYGEFSKIILLESRNTYLSGKVVDESGGPLNALVEVIDKSNKQWIEKSMNDEEGNWHIAVPAGKNYGIVLSKPGYFFQTINTTMPNAIGYERDFKSITLSKIESGKKIALNNVFFESGKAVLKSEIFSDLDLVVKMLIEMPTLQIEVSDNANNLAASKENQQLSKDRAKAVADYLVSKGCDIKRIKYTSYETKEPVTEPGKKADKFASRIDLKILKLDTKAEQLASENRVKEITEEIKRINETNAFGEADSLSEEFAEGMEGSEEVIDTAMVSEYNDSTVVDSLAFTEGEEFVEPVDSTALAGADTIHMEIRNLGGLINSAFADYAPLVSADGSKLLFTSRRPLYAIPVAPPKGKAKIPENKSSIYSSEYEENQEHWLNATPLKQGINLENFNNTAVALSNDGLKMLLYRSPDNLIAEDIMESVCPNKEWSMPMAVMTALNSSGNETSASFSPDGRTIYFVSDRQGTVGLKDIWYCTQNERGVWGEAVNMGDPVNTDKDEECVFMHPNGNALFFSSKGHSSTGGYDIYMTEHNDSSDTWEQPRNLGAYINTPEDDLYFVMTADGKTAYYAATRPDGLGKEDIYQVLLEQNILKKNTTLLKGVVVDETNQPLRAKITIKDKATGKVIASFTSSASTGKYLISLPEGKNYEIKAIVPEHTSYVRTIDLTDKKRYDVLTKNIVLETKNAFLTSKVYDESGRPINKVQIEVIDKTAKQLIERTESDSDGYSRIAMPSNKSIDVVYKKPGYLFQSVSVTLPKFEPAKEYEKDLKTITLQKMEEGKKTVLTNVSFDFNQTVPTQESFLDLARVVSMLNNMPSLQVEVSDHTDNTAVSKEEVKLSKERAKGVADRLINMGVDKKRIRYKSYGATQPLAPNGSEQGRAMNRRVELKILKIDAETERLAEEKRFQEEQPIAEESETNNPFSNESLVDKKDSLAASTKKEESLETKSEEPVVKKEPVTDIVEPVEPKPETDIVSKPEETTEVKKEESVEIKSEEPVVKKEPIADIVEPVEPKPETDIVSKPEETTEVKKEEPVDTKVEEPVVKKEPVTDIVEPVEPKPETDIVSKPEETTEVKKEEPVETKAEEPVVRKEPVTDIVEPVEPKPETDIVSKPEENSETKTEPGKPEAVKKAMLPERFTKFDTDHDGIISSAEINGAIDVFFDDNSTIVADDINAVIDYFFDN